MVTHSRLFTFLFACLEATEPISLMFIFSDIYTFLKGLDIFSSPTMHVRYSSLLVSMTFFGVTVRFSVYKSYWVTFEIASTVKNLEARYSSPSPVSLK